MKKLEEYEIGTNTLAIIPIDENLSRVCEDEDEYLVNKSSNSIIKDNCEFYGSSYDGRCAGTKYLTGIRSKTPIIIEESRNIIFFPTTTTRNKQSTWIALNKIKNYYPNISNYGEITFKNETKLPLDISFYSLDNQICRASILKSKLYEVKQQLIEPEK
jgi:competence protein ComK